MCPFQHSTRRLVGITLLIVMLLVGGCSGITPDGNLMNNREEGPENGLFSGPSGEFVIVAPAAESGDNKDANAEGMKDAKSGQ